jgi:hypothetical protein
VVPAKESQVERVWLSSELLLTLSQIEESVRAWNDADDAHDVDACARLGARIGELAGSLCMGVVAQYASAAVRAYFGIDAPWTGPQADKDSSPSAVTEPSSTVQRVIINTGSQDAECGLLFVADRLVAVFVRLDDEEHAELGLKGRWFLEAGFGPCAKGVRSTLTFDSLGEAQQWALARAAPEEGR